MKKNYHDLMSKNLNVAGEIMKVVLLGAIVGVLLFMLQLEAQIYILLGGKF